MAETGKDHGHLVDYGFFAAIFAILVMNEKNFHNINVELIPYAKDMCSVVNWLWMC